MDTIEKAMQEQARKDASVKIISDMKEKSDNFRKLTDEDKNLFMSVMSNSDFVELRQALIFDRLISK